MKDNRRTFFKQVGLLGLFSPNAKKVIKKPKYEKIYEENSLPIKKQYAPSGIYQLRRAGYYDPFDPDGLCSTGLAPRT